MTAIQDPAKRKLFSRLLNSKNTEPATTSLQRIPAITDITQGVLWAGLALDNGCALVAGDDGVIFYFDGQQWQQENLGTDLPIHALCKGSDNRIFAVGWAGIICCREEQNGQGQWQYMQGGRDPSKTNQNAQQSLPLFDIDAAPNGELWAVGDQGRVVHFRDGEWHEIDSGTSANLRSVLVCENGSVLVGGANGELRQFRDGQWTSIETNTDCHILSMAQIPDGDIYAVGGFYDGDSTGFKGCIFRYTEENWSSLVDDIALPRLRRIRVDGDRLTVVGDQGCAFYWSDKGAKNIHSALRHDLHDIICFPDQPNIICGDGGSLLLEQTLTEQDLESIQTVKAKSQWQTIFSGVIKQTLRGCFSFSDGNAIAVGDGGFCIHISDKETEVKQVPIQVNLHDVWGTSPRNLFAVGDDGCIFHFDGEQWCCVHQGNAPTLLSITGFGPHDIYAVGDEGVILRYDGLMWRRLESGTKSELYHIWGHDPDHILIAAAGGHVLRWNGDNWKAFYVGVEQDLYGVWGKSLSELSVVGISGTLLNLRDQVWHKAFSGVRTDLHAVAGYCGFHANDTHVFAVGSSGTILRQQELDWLLEETDLDVTLQSVSVGEHYAYSVGSQGVILRRKL
ncbi:hypothetical protein R50073_15720 [Maricurvus nonylphenolicus]|uniref:sialidase family protein n=1 Tax=Maricurvus nonylphenolicus TaxID=1008307 RepID=UPI0036F1B111